MFSRSPRKADKSKKDEAATVSIIGADAHLTGEFRSEGDVHVEGVVDGDLHGKSVVVGKSAEVKGDVSGDAVRIWGRITGRVRGRSVAVMPTAEVRGDIVHDELSIAPGSYVEGVLKRQAPPREAAVLPARLPPNMVRLTDADLPPALTG
jgi:cytoskeletal protein CcmA (bactofilin family)